METVRSSETSVNIYPIKGHNISEDSILDMCVHVFSVPVYSFAWKSVISVAMQKQLPSPDVLNLSMLTACCRFTDCKTNFVGIGTDVSRCFHGTRTKHLPLRMLGLVSA
jgi:hypothetical protein